MTDDRKVVRIPPERDFGGEWMLLGDVEVKLPPISFKRIPVVTERFKALAESVRAGNGAWMDDAVDIVATCVQRSYPSMTRDEVAEKLDPVNVGAVLDQIRSVNEFKETSAGELPSP